MKGGVRPKVLNGGRDTPDFSINEEDIEVRIFYITYYCAAIEMKEICGRIIPGNHDSSAPNIYACTVIKFNRNFMAGFHKTCKRILLQSKQNSYLFTGH